MSDDGSITVAQAFCEAAKWPTASTRTIDLRKIIGIDAEITSPTIDGTSDAAWRLATLIDPVTHQMPDGSCERCGAPRDALRDQYCAHCGRRVVRDAKEEAADEAVKKIREAKDSLRAVRDSLMKDDAQRKEVRRGLTMLLNNVVMALGDIEVIVKGARTK